MRSRLTSSVVASKPSRTSSAATPSILGIARRGLSRSCAWRAPMAPRSRRRARHRHFGRRTTSSSAPAAGSDAKGSVGRFPSGSPACAIPAMRAGTSMAATTSTAHGGPTYAAVGGDSWHCSCSPTSAMTMRRQSSSLARTSTSRACSRRLVSAACSMVTSCRISRFTFERPRARATGRAGDVFLCHPFLVHRATWPHRGDGPRMVAQPGVAIPEPFTLRVGPGLYPVEQAILRGLEERSP